MKRNILTVLILMLILLQPTYFVFKNFSTFFAPTYNMRYEQVKKLYFSSQYMIKKNPVIIPDQTLESYAAGAFLKGLNPILIVHDQPPLGRYMLSLSILLFQNENTIMLIFFVFSTIGIYLISKRIIKNYILAFIPVFIAVNEPLTLVKLESTPLLEPIQLPFIIFCIYFFMRFVHQKNLRYVIFSAICLGVVISTRFFVLGFVLSFSQFLFLFYKKDFRLLARYVLALPVSLIVLFASYTRSIQESGNFLAPLGIQKYMLKYHSSKFTQLFTVWDLLMFNRWHTWWGTRSISSDPNWILLWPISTILSGLLLMLGLLRRIRLLDDEIILFLWAIMYLLMLSSGFTSTRYFQPLMPFLYILAVSFIYRIYKYRGHKK